MSQFRRAMLWATLTAVVLLAVLSIYGAFLGDVRAQEFFSSLPLAVYWVASILLLALGIVVFHRLRRVPSLLLMHLGCIVVLMGAIWGSQAGHDIQKRLFGIDKIRQGVMGIYEQTQDNRVHIPDSNATRDLPFFVRLKEFRLEFYEPGDLYIQSLDGRNWRLRAQVGGTLSLGGDLGTITIRRVFRNLKIDLANDQTVAYDAPDGASNPALEVAIEKPGAPPGKRYVFEQQFGHTDPNNPLAMTYRHAIRDYISEMEIVKDGQVVAAKDIEVNHPLYYGGYHFYQRDWDRDRFGEYSVLSVVSNSGLYAVYSGYALLIVGVFWHFWGRRASAWFRAHYTIVANVPEESR